MINNELWLIKYVVKSFRTFQQRIENLVLRVEFH
jgi:hypothetical protein